MAAAVDYVLEALANALEVERECGVRTLEFDRKELVVENPLVKAATPEAAPPPPKAAYDFVFLAEQPLSAAATEVMGKIVTAMGRSEVTAPVVSEGERPLAKIYVVLGVTALAKWFPELKGVNFQWLRGEAGEEVLVVESPECFVRYGSVVTPAMQAVKRKMWDSLKEAMKRLS